MKLQERVDIWRGKSPVEHNLDAYRLELSQIDELGKGLAAYTDAQLQRRALNLQAAIREGDAQRSHRPKSFAIVREVAARVLGERPYDSQILAGLALHDGKLIELATGEGKTLAAVAPVILTALAGRGAHVLTFNDYLATRDAAWMGPIYKFFGLTVGHVVSGMSSADRRSAYRADVTYATAKEAGFDHLRGHLARTPSDVVHRSLHSALVDEADSILIDEARVPLVIAGQREMSDVSPYDIAEVVRSLDQGTDWEYDEHKRNVYLTDRGTNRVESALGHGNLHEDGHYHLLTEVHQALHARTLLHRDIDYIVRDDHIELVDDFTGRVVDDRRWPDGLQAAIEAKEGVQLQPGGRILGSITLQHFLALYERLSGMTATAVPAAEEIHDFYGIKVVPVPSSKESSRVDEPDNIYTHREAKENALVTHIVAQHHTRRPVLVGTASVRESESLAARLRSEGVKCQVLNAKQDEAEAEIIAGAGDLDAVTISTNMAGRGTDIRLGGRDEANRDAVLHRGGLCVIGTNRHESVRIDNQLRGRAGRQGDPGTTRFFLCLDDALLKRFGIDTLIPPKLRPAQSWRPIHEKIVHKEVDRLQRIVEGQNYDIRTTLHKYAVLVEMQRSIFLGWRSEVLAGTAASLLAVQNSALYTRLCEETSKAEVWHAEQLVSLHHIDLAWTEHLALVSHVREGIHLVGIGGLNPLREFQKTIAAAFSTMETKVHGQIVETMSSLQISGGKIQLDDEMRTGPASTWTYLVSDQVAGELQRMLFGQGSGAFGAGAALMTWPLLIAWGIRKRFMASGKNG